MIPAKREFPSKLLQRTLAILSAFRQGEPALTITELSERSELPRSTTYRLVTELVELGFLERTGHAVSLGMSLFELGQLASRRSSLREIALPYIADLREATHQTIHFAILQGTEVVYLEILPARSGPQLPSRVGGRLSAHATGVGKALLAHSSAETVDRVVAGGLLPVGPGTICDETEFRRQLRKIKTTNIAYDYQESGAGIVCAASAIMNASGQPLAAVSASGWFGRVDLRRVGPAVLTSALAIARNANSRASRFV